MYPTVKRAADIVLSALILAVTAPIWLIVAAWIRLDSPGPVLYRGRRIAKGGGTFLMRKFRTMRVDADRIGGPSTAGDDPRITRSGRWLRRTKLDELPQLVNVLTGEMSIVGPRPEVESERPVYEGAFARILQVRPGITDWASIWNADEGAVLAGAADAHALYKARIQPTKLRLQLKYVDEISWSTDMRIVVCTVRKIVDRGFVPAALVPFGTP